MVHRTEEASATFCSKNTDKGDLLHQSLVKLFDDARNTHVAKKNKI